MKVVKNPKVIFNEPVILVAAHFPVSLDDRCRLAAATARITKAEWLRQAAEYFLTAPVTITANHQPSQEVHLEPA